MVLKEVREGTTGRKKKLLGPRTDGVEETNDLDSRVSGLLIQLEKYAPKPQSRNVLGKYWKGQDGWNGIKGQESWSWGQTAMSKTLRWEGSIIKKVYVDITPLGVSEKFRILVYSNTLSPFVSYLEFGLFGFLFPDTENFCCISTGCQETLWAMSKILKNFTLWGNKVLEFFVGTFILPPRQEDEHSFEPSSDLGQLSF